MSTKSLTKRQNRWALFLSEFNFRIRYSPGGLNGKADMLSRCDGPLEEGVVQEKPLLDPVLFEEIGVVGLKIQLLGKEGRMPIRGSKDAAGYDLFSTEN